MASTDTECMTQSRVIRGMFAGIMSVVYENRDKHGFVRNVNYIEF